MEDLDRSCYCVGGMTTNDLVGAALTAAELGNRDSLSETEVATKLMTVVIHDSDKKHNMLMAIIPLSNETGQLISEVVLRLRDLFFARGWFLVFGGGDGAAANLDAWRRVKSHSTGSSQTLLRDVWYAWELPFFGGSDDDQHNTKVPHK